MIVLNLESVVTMHGYMIEETGGTEGIRDKKSLDSALNSPFHTAGGDDLFPTKLEKAARLGYGIIANHPFVDGNKRVGIHAMILFLDLNGIHIEFSNKELIDLGLGVASGQLKYEDVYKFLKRKGEASYL